MSDNLAWLQQFYLSFCNDDWEHSYGCTIENLDNPGWSFKFDLADTGFENLGGLDLKLGEHSSEDGPDWIFLKKEGSTVIGACGPLKLDELIGHFRAWVLSINEQAKSVEASWNDHP